MGICPYCWDSCC